MECSTCRTPMVRVDMINEWFCPVCTKCNSCNQRPAQIDKRFGVLHCQECLEELASKIPPLQGGRWLSGGSIFEYAATPFWKHMGLKPTKEEAYQEKQMKWRGLSYRDLARLRNGKGDPREKQRMSKITKLALEGKLTDEVEKSARNRRERLARHTFKKTS